MLETCMLSYLLLRATKFKLQIPIPCTKTCILK